MILVAVLCIVLYQVFKRHPIAGRRFVLICLIGLFCLRLTNQIIRASVGAEVPILRALPFHMCNILCFLFPIVYIFHLKKLLEPVCVLSIMGGMIAVLVSTDYFNNQFLTFHRVESMIAHTILLLVPLILLAVGDLKLHLKNIWQPFALILIMTLWALFGNEVLFKGYDTNYMYLRENGLPDDLGGKYYLWVYIAIYFIFLLAIYRIPPAYSKIKRLLKQRRHANETICKDGA
jgi:uncharacterized membrane protein YwaF